MSESNNNIDPDKIHLEYIERVSVSLDEFKSMMETNNSISINAAHMSAHNIQENKYLLGLQIVFSTNDSLKTIECSFRYNFHFSVENLNEMYKLNEKDSPIFKKLFVATLTGISYSTLRGIIFEKTLNTDLGVLTLPVMNPSQILDSWIEKE